MTTLRKTDWDRVYASKDPAGVSWYQPVPARSLALVEACAVGRNAPIIDVGGGASLLVDNLLERGYTDLTVLDIAGSALALDRERLGAAAESVQWVEADVLELGPQRRYALWHDRAVLHFLTDAGEQRRYVEVLRAALARGGHAIIATFGPDGPQKCSGLDVQRHSVDSLQSLLGDGFQLREHVLEMHPTPFGTEQQFLYGWWTLFPPEQRSPASTGIGGGPGEQT